VRRLLLVWVVLLSIGAAAAWAVGDALAVRFEPAAIPEEHLTVAPARPPAPAPDIGAVEVPDRPRLTVAADNLRTALAEADGDDRRSRRTVRVRVTGGDEDADDESHTLRMAGDVVTIEAASDAGAALGLDDLADRIRTGRPLYEDAGRRVTPRLPFRMVDLGAVGVTVDPDEWRPGTDYSHHSAAFRDVMLEDAPYVDRAALATATREMRAYVDHVLSLGYNAIAIPGFVEYLTFADVGVYDADDPHVARARALRAAFGPLWRYAHDRGMRVFLRTDMLALTTPLEEYFDELGLTPEDDELWAVYQTGLDELYAAMPYVDGLLLRIGEGGSIYNLPGWDYYSELAVTSVDAVRTMLLAFIDQAERADKEVIFRTWSVGIGAVGDMHTDPASYDAVLDGIVSDHFIVSTKYSLGDFYSYLPFNDTLEIGQQRRIVELQSRREFEAFGAIPNDLGTVHAEALRHFLAANPLVEGIWAWTQDGGPWRAGPMTMELKTGLWQLYELNTYTAARLAQDPGQDPAELTADWARRWFSDDPATVRAIGEAMALSREAVAKGLYISTFADQRVFALGLEPPPMMWLFEWDIVTGDSATLDLIHEVSKDRLDEAIAEGHDAVDVAERMRTLLADTDAATWRDPDLRTEMVAAVDYEISQFEVLAAYREMFLRHAQWLDTGAASARSAWAVAKERYEEAGRAHLATYDGDVDRPPLNLTAADIGVERAERDRPMAWAARLLLLLLLGWAVAARWVPAARAHLVGALTPWRVRPEPSWLLIAVPAALVTLSRGVYTWFAAPAHLLITLGAWLLFGAAVWMLTPRRHRWAAMAALGGTALLRTAALLGVLALRGPGRYWLMFWTEPAGRAVYLTIGIALFCWVVVATAWAARSAGTILMAVGLPLLVLGTLVGAIGLEDALTAWNDQMALLPWGMARILGITTFLAIPTWLPWAAALAGGLVGLAGAFLRVRAARPKTT
jgi:hypothetical protein